MPATVNTPAASAPTTNLRATVAHYANALRETVRSVRASAPRGTGDPAVRQLAKDYLSRPREKGIEHIVALIVDQARRGDLVGAERIGRELIGIARLEYRRVQDVTPVSLAEAHRAEEHAEGLLDEAECALAYERSPANVERLLERSAAYHIAREQLDDCARQLRAHT